MWDSPPAVDPEPGEIEMTQCQSDGDFAPAVDPEPGETEMTQCQSDGGNGWFKRKWKSTKAWTIEFGPKT